MLDCFWGITDAGVGHNTFMNVLCINKFVSLIIDAVHIICMLGYSTDLILGWKICSVISMNLMLNSWIFLEQWLAMLVTVLLHCLSFFCLCYYKTYAVFWVTFLFILLLSGALYKYIFLITNCLMFLKF